MSPNCSGSYNTSQLVLSWEGDSPVKVNKQLQLTEYSLKHVYVNKSEAQYSMDEDDNSENLNFFGKFGKFVEVSTTFTYLICNLQPREQRMKFLPWTLPLLISLQKISP